jgi:PAS domain S-box-containing protein
MYVLLRDAAVRRDEAFFSERVAEAQAAIEVRVSHYVDALHGGASFFTAAPNMDRDTWRIFAESLNLRVRYPGINGLGVILAIAPHEVEGWRARVRRADEPPPEIKPFPGTSANSEEHAKYLISFLEGNLSGPPPIGRNIATDASRRQAAELARDTGQPQFNQRVPGSRDMQRRSGLLLYVPLYRKGGALDTVVERRAAHLGWVYAQVYPDVFLDGVLGPVKNTLRLHFFEAGERTRERLLFASDDPGDGPLPNFERVTNITLAGQEFQLGWRRGPAFPHADRSAAGWVAGSIGCATLLLAGLVLSLQSVSRRANAIAHTRTAELAASEERFRQSFEFAGIGMALVATDGRLLRVNSSFCEIVGYPEARLLQKTFAEITHPDDLAADLTMLAELTDGKRRSYQLEKRYLHRDGHSVWVRLTVSLVRDTAGAPLHAIAQVEDITERKRLAANLASAHDRAVADSRLKAESLALLLEEIRTPTKDVLATAALLRTTTLGPGQTDYVRAIEAAGGALQATIDDISDYSKMESGEITLQVAPFDLRACVGEAVAAFAERAREKRLRLETAIAARVPSGAMGDEKRLRQILAHLLNNALKFTTTGEVRVNVTAEALDATTGKQRLKFAVRDTGNGMVADEVERLFKSFSKVEPATRRPGGPGLGLAISKRLAELMGGTMWAESEPGRGSTFHFTVVIEPREVKGS